LFFLFDDCAATTLTLPLPGSTGLTAVYYPFFLIALIADSATTNRAKLLYHS